ncbi:MAG: DUF4956 domain-containing protein [Clostridiales bacterium]|nr:DUF4956 domain-containing protein [Clostridiales bacterium]
MKELIDAFRESVAQSGIQLDLSPQYIILCLLTAGVCAAVIALVYRFFYRGSCYSANFTILFVISTLVTTFALMTISANLVLSLGMVGALSIVRFRAAIKDPLDVGFLFWAIVVGIACGAGLFTYSILCTLFIAVVYIAMTLVKSGVHSYLLVLCYDSSAKIAVDKTLEELKCRKKVKSLTHAKGHEELTVQLKLNKEDNSIAERFDAIAGVSSAMMVEYTGDI